MQEQRGPGDIDGELSAGESAGAPHPPPPPPLPPESPAAAPIPSLPDPLRFLAESTAYAAGIAHAELPEDRPSAPAPGALLYNGQRWQPAGLYPRVWAFLLDFAILASAFWLLGKAVDMPQLDPALVFAAQMTVLAELIIGQEIDPAAARIAEDALKRERFRGWMNVLMCCAYFTLFHGLSGASPGKHALGLRVLRKDGRLPGLGWAFARYVGYLAVAKLYYSAWLIPFEKEKRTLYDLLLGMNVYKRVRG